MVHINVSQQESRPLEEKTSDEALGTGFFIDREGHILTNYHVVERSNHISVYLPAGRNTLAQVIGTAPNLDLALLKVDVEESDQIEPLTLGDSDAVEVGQKVVAVGNPFAFHNSLTVGVLSAIGRSIPGSFPELEHSLIQTDAAINPGNSGGPLVNSGGDVIGITEARVPNAQSLGFAIPINLAKYVIPDLISMGHPYRPALGIDGIEITSELADLFGLPLRQGFLIENVVRGSLADRAGIRPGNRTVLLGDNVFVLGGDIVNAVDGKEVSTMHQMTEILLRSRPGQRLRFSIFREGEIQDVTLPLQPMHQR